MQHDVARAEESVSLIQEIVANHSSNVPTFLVAFYLERFLTYIHCLEEACNSQTTTQMADYQRKAFHSGKAALKNACKCVPYLTWTLRLMGNYYCLIGKQGKAMKSNPLVERRESIEWNASYIGAVLEN